MSTQEEIDDIIESLRSELTEVDSKYEQSKHELDQARIKSEELKLKKTEIEKNIHLYRAERKKVNKREKETLEVSDHAVVRFMKRVMGMDIDSLKEEIMKGKAPTSMPDGKYPLVHTDKTKYTVVVKNNVVVTVISNEESECGNFGKKRRRPRSTKRKMRQKS